LIIGQQPLKSHAQELNKNEKTSKPEKFTNFIKDRLVINNNFPPRSNSQILTQIIKRCPREFTGWEIIKSFETETYNLALCQQDNMTYLVGHKKTQNEAFIAAEVITNNNNLIVAKDAQGLSIEISESQLKISDNEKLIAQENLINQNFNETKIQPQSKLIGQTWQLQEIYDDKNELINIDNQTNYTIEFLSNKEINIKADCNRAKGTYQQVDN